MCADSYTTNRGFFQRFSPFFIPLTIQRIAGIIDKECRPEDLALISPSGRSVCISPVHGVMEYWSAGVMEKPNDKTLGIPAAIFFMHVL